MTRRPRRRGTAQEEAPVRGEGFPPRVRILSSAEYRELARHGKRFHTTHFVVIYRPGRRAVSRLGLTASRKVGNAVVRNRIKRWLREGFRRNRRQLPAPWDMVWIARPRAGSIDHPQLDREMQSLLDYLARRDPSR